MGGYYAHSLAVMSDAAHLLSDLGTLCMSLTTLTYAARRAPATHSFGLHRAELLGALFSVASLWAVTGALLYAAAQRLRQPERVQGQAMMAIALLGVAVNVALAAVLSGAQGHGHSHGGLRGAEGACDGGHGHSHGDDAAGGADCCGAEHEEDEEAGLLPRAANGSSSSGELRARACGGGGCGHSHGAPAAGRPPLVPMRLGAPEAAAAEAQAPPAGAVFFTRGRMPSSSGLKGSNASLASDDSDGSATPGGTVPAALAAAMMAASPPPSPARASRSSAHMRSSSGGRGSAPAAAAVSHSRGACGGEATDVNMRGAYLHVLADLAQSCGVAVAGMIIWARPSLRWLDPLCTLGFSAAVLVASSRLLRDVVDVIMERTPRGVDAAALSAELAALPGVAGVHDLHVWALMPGKLLLTVHLDAAPGARSRDVLHAAQRVAHRRLGLAHATIQVEGASA